MILNEKTINEIVTNVLSSLIKENETKFQFNNILKDFSAQIEEYIKSETERINSLKNIKQNVMNELISSNRDIENLNINFNNITLSSDNMNFTISYYIANSQEWSESDFEQIETDLYYIEKHNKYIDIELVSEINTESHIDITFNISDYE